MRKSEHAMAAKRESELELDAKSTRVGELKTEEVKSTEQPASLKTAGRFKRGDLTADVKIRMCLEEGDILSGRLNSSARRHDCGNSTARRVRSQVSETVLTKRDKATRDVLEDPDGHDLIVPSSVALSVMCSLLTLPPLRLSSL